MKIFHSCLLVACLLAPIAGQAIDLDIDLQKAPEGYGVVNPDGFGVGAREHAATAEAPDLLAEEENWQENTAAGTIADPLEGWNRAMFTVNDRLYVWALRPAADLYAAVLPQDIRGSIDNFFTNLTTPVRFVNTLLQGRFHDAGTEFSRFAINSVLGVAGLADVAGSEMGIKLQRADFGQTLGRYGVGEGLYLCWPVFGPSTLRDTGGIVVDNFSNPTTYADWNVGETVLINTTQVVNKMSVSPDVYGDIKKNSLDPYVAMRQGYVDYRRAFIRAARQ